MKYAILSVSSEGEYFLVNGWKRNRAFWISGEPSFLTNFKRKQDAITSLTKLLKVMDDYESDTFYLCEVDNNNLVVSKTLIARDDAGKFVEKAA